MREEVLTKEQVHPLLIPTIFADGKNDDLEGFAACVMNDSVLYRGKIYHPGEAMFVENEHLWFSVNAIQINGVDIAMAVRKPGLEESLGLTVYSLEPIARINTPTVGREVLVQNSNLHFNFKRT